MERQPLLRGCFTPWVVFGAMLFAIALFIVAVVLLFLSRGTPTAPPPSTAIINVIPAPTATPIPVTVVPPTATPTQPGVPPSPPPGVINIGAFVQISGTGGDGLRVRADPSLGSKTLFVALESEVFQVKDGPRQADGYTWWYLVSPSDPSLAGWAVSNYLVTTQQP